MRGKMLRAYRRAVLALVMTLALGAAGGCVKNPVTGEEQMMLLSPAQEVQIGAENFPKVVQLNYGTVPDAAANAYVNRVGKRVAGFSHTPGWPWQFTVVNNSTFNAFALPGGKIAVNRGLLAKMQSEDELAAVLAHEIGHVTARHSAAQYSRSMLTGLLLGGLAVALSDNPYGNDIIQAAGAAGGLLMLSYSRDQERQADDLGYMYMTRAGYNPKGMVRLFGIFQEVDKEEPSQISAWLSSHPLTSERIASARNMVERTTPALVNQPMKTADFNRAMATQHLAAPAYEAMDKGDRAFAKKRYADAVRWHKMAIGLYPDEGLFHASLAQALLKQKDKRGAVAAAREGARRSPQVFFCQFMAGVTYAQIGDPRGAVSAFARADKLLPDHPLNLYLAAQSLEKMRQTQKAAQLYRKVIELDPKGEYGQAARGRLARLPQS